MEGACNFYLRQNPKGRHAQSGTTCQAQDPFHLFHDEAVSEF